METIVPSLNRIDTIVPEYLRQLAEDLLEKCFAQVGHSFIEKREVNANPLLVHTQHDQVRAAAAT